MADIADIVHMARALDLARRGLYTTSPNPRVGCVLVRHGKVIGEGYHARAGEPHAEVCAIADALARGESADGATAYVSLEPCNHQGRTAPCTHALVDARISRVVVAMPDPNPVAAHGAAYLRERGISVVIGVMNDEARALNRGFVSRFERGRPWVRMKVASSLDGRTALATGQSQWITGAEARADGHHWRAQACAILTGIGTIRTDDPQLTVRAVETTRQPQRIIVDRQAETPVHAKVLDAGAVMVVTSGARNDAWPAHVEHLMLPDAEGRVNLRALFEKLARRGTNEVHVEAGAGLNGALLHAGLVDELVMYLAPCLLGDPARGIAQFASGLGTLDERIFLDVQGIDRLGSDLRLIANVIAHGRSATQGAAV
ncbi:MAG: bifunctional diaminohydroxyphosphoribosylaminopyrimidine deaminase/5-amino-6-(5-phosphoribosylamino)uracil reductase RibD [Pseudomonadota bacterium]|nr:bifunctional diaminohydroxyphosphoribosylaminopyrimidine deaminase/5-amino-6-(5-phosphoribosylamino)uracil reductase RibD [Pseudomonadota bacterium]